MRTGNRAPNNLLIFKSDSITLEEVEVEEMIEAWYHTAYVPLFGTDREEPEIKDNAWQCNDYCKRIQRFYKLEATLLNLMAHPHYRIAFERVIKTLPRVPSSQRLVSLLKIRPSL